MLVQEHNSDQFARISLEVEPDEPDRIVQLRMGPIERPAEFPYGSLTDVEVIAQARTQLHALADAGQFAGVMLIQHDGRTVYSDVLGEADRTRHIANTMDTRFRIGWMNEMFTAVATLQLVAAGKLQLDAPIGRYLPDYPDQDVATRVTVRHLLTHTGGTEISLDPTSMCIGRRCVPTRISWRSLDHGHCALRPAHPLSTAITAFSSWVPSSTASAGRAITSTSRITFIRRPYDFHRL